MTEREKELIGYIRDLLHMSQRETLWPRGRETWERIAAATHDDREMISAEGMREAGYVRVGNTWTNKERGVSVSIY